MKTLTEISELKSLLTTYKKENLTIGFVPTMGFLHQGHLSLVEQCKKACDICVVSIYVNPSQFNEKSDFESYPKNEQNDKSLLEDAKCDVLWIPSQSEIESIPLSLNYNVNDQDQVLEGAFRKGHFKGVLEVVYRLFKAVEPNIAFFGEKDFQQFVLIKTMVSVNKLPLKILSVPTSREEDGLAMSSRNTLLKPEHRKIAPELNAVLQLYSTELKPDLDKAKNQLIKKGFEVEYLIPHQFSKEGKRLFVAARLGNVRLIDNVPCFS